MSVKQEAISYMESLLSRIDKYLRTADNGYMRYKITMSQEELLKGAYINCLEHTHGINLAKYKSNPFKKPLEVNFLFVTREERDITVPQSIDLFSAYHAKVGIEKYIAREILIAKNNFIMNDYLREE